MRQMNHNHNLFWFAWFCLYTTVKCARNVASSFFFHKKKNALDLMDFGGRKKTLKTKQKRIRLAIQDKLFYKHQLSP